MNLYSRLFIAVCGVYFFIASVGCTEEKKPSVNVRQSVPAASSKSRENNVSDAMRYLPMLMRLDRTMAVKEVVYQLNAWAQTYDAKDKFHNCSLVGSLSQMGQDSPIVQSLPTVRFHEGECEYLLQCKMMKQVGQWVLQKPYLDEVFADWVTETGKSLSDDERRKLLDTVKLFDWTVRNVALNGEAREAEVLLTQPIWPLEDGQPAYGQLPWQTMIYGRGDTWLRARVFTQLLQQVDIPACVLAIEDTATKAPNLWAIGVPIGNELYVFEPHWGMPLPGSGERGIATLKQIREDPTVLRRARLSGSFEYPVTAADLDRLILLIDVDPYAISHSMFAVEPMLAGDNRMNVYVDADEIATTLAKFVPAKSIGLWEIPLLATHYNMSVRGRVFDKSPFSMQYLSVFGAFFTDTLMNTARQNHFAGKFQSDSDSQGALQNYMALRVDDATLDKLGYDQTVQKSLSVQRGKDEPAEAFVARTEQYKAFFRVAKFHTSSFLGMAQIDLGNYDAAIDWLDTRTLQVSDTQAWHPHAEYLLARCYELKGDYKKASEYLRNENRPQEAGNRIRARMLQSRVENAATAPK